MEWKIQSLPKLLRLVHLDFDGLDSVVPLFWLVSFPLHLWPVCHCLIAFNLSTAAPWRFVPGIAIAAANIRMVLSRELHLSLALSFIAMATWMLILIPNDFHATSKPSWPFPLTSPADFLEPHISPSSVFLFLSSPQPDSPPGQVPPGGPWGWHSGAGVPCFREAQADNPVVAGRQRGADAWRQHADGELRRRAAYC